MNHRPYLHAVLTVSARALADTDPDAAATIQGAAHTLIAALAAIGPRHAASPRTALACSSRPAARPPASSPKRSATSDSARSATTAPRWTPTPPSPTSLARLDAFLSQRDA